jgi:hypothetical protein
VIAGADYESHAERHVRLRGEYSRNHWGVVQVWNVARRLAATVPGVQLPC